jgi:hypothetical protein
MAGPPISGTRAEPEQARSKSSGKSTDLPQGIRESAATTTDGVDGLGQRGSAVGGQRAEASTSRSPDSGSASGGANYGGQRSEASTTRSPGK